MRIWPKAKSVSTTVMLACALLATAANAMVTPPRRILLVYESGAFAPSALELQRGILSHLRQALGQDAEFFSEQLETTRFAETEGQAISWIRKRYAEHRIDVVIFVGSGEPDILPGVATVYAGNTPFKTSNDVSPQDNKTAVVFKVDLGKTVLAARRLQPGARRVLVITGSAYEDRVLLEEAGNQLTKSDVPVAYLTDASPPGAAVNCRPFAARHDRIANLLYPRRKREYLLLHAGCSRVTVTGICSSYLCDRRHDRRKRSCRRIRPELR